MTGVRTWALPISQSPQLTSEDLTERLIRNALRQQDWQSASQWLAQLPEASRESDRWRYWRARVMEELDLEPEDGPSAMDLYAAVADRKSTRLNSSHVAISYAVFC